jgi:hypothetical protein
MFPRYLGRLFGIKPKFVYPVILWAMILLPLAFSLLYLVGLVGNIFK